MHKFASILGTLLLIPLLVVGCGNSVASGPPSVSTPTKLSAVQNESESPVSLAAAKGTDGELKFMDFLSPQVGWLTIEKRSGANDTIFVFKTEDGGMTWLKQFTFDAFGNPIAGWTKFLNVQDGYLVGAGGKELYLTKDGGAHWLKWSLPTEVEDVQMIDFVDPNTGWILGDRQAAMGSEKATVYHTTDGGETWNLVSQTSDTDATSGQLPSVGNKNGVSFKNGSTGWITGTVNGALQSFLFVTQDGGKQWKAQTLDLPAFADSAPITTYPPQFVSSTDGFLPVQIEQSIQWYHTQDGGMHWSPVGNINGLLESPTGYHFIDADTGWMFTGQNWWMTTDSAVHWTKTTLGATIIGMDFITNRQGWMLSSQGPDKMGLTKTELQQTTTGGQSWKQIK